MSNNKRVALYCRVAREDDTAMEGQARMIQNFAEEQGYINTVLYSDNGVSGIGLNRPAFGCLSADILAGQIKTVIVKDLSRISRNPLELAGWFNGIQRCGVSCVSVQEGVMDDAFSKKDELFQIYSEYLKKIKQ